MKKISLVLGRWKSKSRVNHLWGEVVTRMEGTDIDESGEEEVRMSEEVKAKQAPTQTCGACRNDICQGQHL